MRSALLCGREHARLGAIDLVAEGPAAIAISLGGAPKVYRHTDPNEDAALFAVGDGGILAVVADGHSGCEASETAIRCLLERFAPEWTGAEPLDPGRWPARVLDVLSDLEAAVIARTADTPRRGSRTTLALAVVRPGQARAFVASIGDSHVFRVGAAGVDDLVLKGQRCDPRFFLGRECSTREELGGAAIAEVADLARVQALVLATDGLSERRVGVEDPEEAVRRAVESARAGDAELRPVEAARNTAQAALDAQRSNRSGDNVAVAVVWTETEPRA
ncbi:MAG: protein phosphatase 2C domain-containing protein [Deltaproteobacteria bacterium]|nr:MAG: protein phosphatase 2C domain-containing protein [Deltaproteobacteria bacterium]